jgi:membrane protease subunit (stomatin/prohibitin family)
MAQTMMQSIRPPEPAGPAPGAPAAAAGTDTKFCLECGKPVPRPAKFCPECGKPQQ